MDLQKPIHDTLQQKIESFITFNTTPFPIGCREARECQATNQKREIFGFRKNRISCNQRNKACSPLLCVLFSVTEKWFVVWGAPWKVWRSLCYRLSLSHLSIFLTWHARMAGPSGYPSLLNFPSDTKKFDNSCKLLRLEDCFNEALLCSKPFWIPFRNINIVSRSLI